ncbi:MAG: SPFH domain-containing protein [Candidatus Babeliales bacterium]
MIEIGIFLIVLLVIGAFILAQSVYLIRQSEALIIERFGRFDRVLTPGLHMIMPFMDRPHMVVWTFLVPDGRGKYMRILQNVTKIDLREAVYDFPKQNVITKDNVTMEINALLYYQITDPKAAIYEVANLPEAIEKLTQTTLRNVIGSLDLDETLTSRDQINEKLRIILDEATDKWGVKVNRVELQEVNPPHDIRQAMEKQMRAERDRRAKILESEGTKRAAILEAEGMQESSILRAKGIAESQVITATAEAEARLKIAQAEAKAIEMIQQAMPAGDPMHYMIATQYIKALPELTKGKDDKLVVIPYEAASLAGSVASIKKIFQEVK